MPNLTSVTVTAGVPTAGTGTVSTIDALMAVIGEVQASPTANTALDRLKAINTSAFAKGTAGTPSADVVTVQGATSMTPLATTLAAGTALAGIVSSPNETSSIYNGATALTPKFKVISASSSGANTVVAAVTSKKIRVLAWDVKVNAAVNFKWQSHVTPTDLTGLYYNSGQGDGVARAFCPVGYFETVAGEALDINLSGAVAVGGVLTYVEV